MAAAGPFHPLIYTMGQGERLFDPRRAAENGNFNTFCPRRAAKGHEGPRRTATATPFCPRRAAKGHEGPRRTATATPFCPRRAAKGHEGPRRTATATPFCPRRAAKGHEGPRRTTKKTLNPFIHEGPRRAMKDHEKNLFFHEGALRLLIHATIQADGSGLRLTKPASNDDGGWLRRGFWRGRCGGCQLQWSVVSG